MLVMDRGSSILVGGARGMLGYEESRRGGGARKRQPGDSRSRQSIYLATSQARPDQKRYKWSRTVARVTCDLDLNNNAGAAR
jgi:hypothetical protein